MPRIARIVVPGYPHHITQRGNNREAVFFGDADRRAYLRFLKEQCDRFGLRVHAYCLMENHVHLVATPDREQSLSQAVGRTHWLYTRYVNRRRGRQGHLWQNRFYSCVLDEAHFWTAMAYVETNPVRAKLVRQPALYPWSSAAAHATGQDPTALLDMDEWKQGPARRDSQARIPGGPSAADIARLRQSTHRGRPLGGEHFLKKLEQILGLSLHTLPVGRPRKGENK